MSVPTSSHSLSLTVPLVLASLPVCASPHSFHTDRGCKRCASHHFGDLSHPPSPLQVAPSHGRPRAHALLWVLRRDSTPTVPSAQRQHQPRSKPTTPRPPACEGCKRDPPPGLHHPAPRLTCPALPAPPMRTCVGTEGTWGMRAQRRVAREGRGHTERVAVQPERRILMGHTIHAVPLLVSKGCASNKAQPTGELHRQKGCTKADMRKGNGDGAPRVHAKGGGCASRMGCNPAGAARERSTLVPSRST